MARAIQSLRQSRLYVLFMCLPGLAEVALALLCADGGHSLVPAGPVTVRRLQRGAAQARN